VANPLLDTLTRLFNESTLMTCLWHVPPDSSQVHHGTSEWKELTEVGAGYPTWSTDGEWVYSYDLPSNVIYRIEVATGRREEILRPIVRSDFEIAVDSGWVGWTSAWDPIMLRDVGTDQLYRIDLDR
jgi:hypothetical protein